LQPAENAAISATATANGSPEFLLLCTVLLLT
jgi:hypothetical protein